MSVRLARIAALAAVAATLGDLAMLYVGNAMRADMALPAAPPGLLWLGCLAGVLGLPLYGLGYTAAARTLAPGMAGVVVRVAGIATGLAGAVVHGYTAWLIQRDVDAGAVASAPADAVAAGGPLLLGAWGVTGVAMLLAGLTFAFAHARRHGLGRAVVWCNPIAAIAVLVLVAQPSAWLQAFLLPAAPNLAHVPFFALLWLSARGGRWHGSRLAGHEVHT